MAYIYPSNSFIKPYVAPLENCAEQISLCLPVYDVNDIGFSFVNSLFGSNHSFEYILELYVDGVQVGTPKTMLKQTTTGTVGMTSVSSDLVWIQDISSMGFETEIEDGQCFALRVTAEDTIQGSGDPPTVTVLFQSNCLQKITDPCWSSVIKYRCEENSFDFIQSITVGASTNSSTVYQIIRLPFYLKEPQPNTKRNVFVKSDGSRKKLSARIEMEYQGATDYMPKDWHEKLVVALECDEVLISNTNSGYTLQAFSQEGNYEIDWQKFLDYPTAPAKFKVFKTPYQNSNSNCL